MAFDKRVNTGCVDCSCGPWSAHNATDDGPDLRLALQRVEIRRTTPGAGRRDADRLHGVGAALRADGQGANIQCGAVDIAVRRNRSGQLLVFDGPLLLRTFKLLEVGDATDSRVSPA